MLLRKHLFFLDIFLSLSARNCSALIRINAVVTMLLNSNASTSSPYWAFDGVDTACTIRFNPPLSLPPTFPSLGGPLEHLELHTTEPPLVGGGRCVMRSYDPSYNYYLPSSALSFQRYIYFATHHVDLITNLPIYHQTFETNIYTYRKSIFI